MRETGILFCADMVRATLAGTKDVTRRTRGLEEINERPNAWRYNGENIDDNHLFFDVDAAASGHEPPDCIQIITCPYGGPGDLLYGKEVHWRFGRWVKDGKTKKGRDRWRFYGVATEVVFEPQPKVSREQLGWHKRPGIFMPKRAARIWRRIVSGGPERLHDITEADCIREGVERGNAHRGRIDWRRYDGSPYVADSARESYRTLWDSINGPGAWDRNSYVWRIESVSVTKEGLL